jgi:hypothetical protein
VPAGRAERDDTEHNLGQQYRRGRAGQSGQRRGRHDAGSYQDG